MKPAAKITYQTVEAKIKHLNSCPALAFSVFCNRVINGTRFIKLRYLYICVTGFLSKVGVELHAPD